MYTLIDRTKNYQHIRQLEEAERKLFNSVAEAREYVDGIAEGDKRIALIESKTRWTVRRPSQDNWYEEDESIDRKIIFYLYEREITLEIMEVT